MTEEALGMLDVLCVVGMHCVSLSNAVMVGWHVW